MNKQFASLIIETLQTALQRADDDALIRDIVRDQRVPPSQLPPSPKVTVQGAPRVTTSGSGWVDPPSVDDWQPPGKRHLDALMDAEDAVWRAERAREFTKRGG